MADDPILHAVSAFNPAAARSYPEAQSPDEQLKGHVSQGDQLSPAVGPWCKLPHMQMPHVRMPTGAPTMWPPLPPPPPPCLAPPLASGCAAPTSDTGAQMSATEVPVHVSERVSSMIAAATKASESQVSAELKRLNAGFLMLKTKISKVEALLNQQDPSSVWLHQDALSKTLSQVEQNWESEIKAVKRELHQTILAHNHNADVMADHKTAIDQICADLVDPATSVRSDTDSGFHEHLGSITSTIENNIAQEQEIDVLLHRAELLMQRFGALGIAVAPPLGCPVPATLYGSGVGYFSGFGHLPL